MNCYICDQNDFHSMGGLNPERELLVCKTCGNVLYRMEPEEEKKILDYYRFAYRPAPTITNLITSSHKQTYVGIFLREFLKDKKGMVCGDVGSAIGYIPNMLRAMGHRATGCELTVTYRRFCENFYGIPLTEDLDPKHRYDLITIYHVLEHLIEPDKKLKKYVDMLADDGRIMIATPEWFERIEEASGTPIATFQHWFHKDHINVFSATSIKNLFRKCGLVIEKEDHITYGQTYLLRKATASDAPPAAEGKFNFFNVEPWEEQVKKIEQIDKAISLMQQGNREFMQKKEGGPYYTEALEIWPKFPDVWLQIIMQINMKNPEQQEKLFKEVFALMPDNARIRLAHAVWLYQNERFQEALAEFEWMLNHRPSEDIWMYAGWCLEKLGNLREAIKAFRQSAAENPQKWNEAYGHICYCSANLPSWDEQAQEQIKKELFKQAAPVLAPRDAVMDGPDAPKPTLEIIQ